MDSTAVELFSLTSHMVSRLGCYRSGVFYVLRLCKEAA